MRESGLGYRRMLAAAACVLVAVVVVGCGGGSGGTGGGGGSGSGAADEAGTPQKGGTLLVADQGEAVTLSPFTEVPDNMSVHVFAQIIETLYRTDSEGKVVPDLAETTKPSKDFKTWTIGLRKGAKFTNGQPLTAEDVVFSLEQAIANPTWGAFFEPIKTVTAKGKDTVVVTTDRTFPTLETVLSLFGAGIVPKNFGGESAKEFEHAPIGTGPFKLGKWLKGKSLTLEKNPDYWNPKLPYLDKVVLQIVPDSESRLLQLRSGQLNLIAQPPQSQATAIENTPGLRLGEFSLAIPDYFQVNLNKGPFENAKLREAADLAIDRKGILDAALSGHGKVGTSWFAPAMGFFDSSIKTEHDPAKAKELVAEAVKEGANPSFTMMVKAGDSYSGFASQIIQENLNEVGFKVKIESLDEATVTEKVFTGEYEASLYGITSDITEPSEIVSFYNELEALATGAPVDKMSKLLAEANAESDRTKREAIYHTMQQEVAKEHNLIPLDYRPWTWAMQESVAGFDLPPTGIPWYAEVGFSE
ncbi:MAG: ABC transporter substrate-binding protein [Actinobacteria bacterium]|nr:ABC transporter substrate-binding protein [Actinomycetota bacterium]